MIKLWDLHTQFEFADKSVEKTMETMTSNPFVTHVPTMAGGRGIESLTYFYGTDFIPTNPPDMKIVPVSRTVGDTSIVDELIVSFTHTQEVNWILPGVPPTLKFVRFPLVAIVGFENGKINSEHIYWDQASVLYQLGLIKKSKHLERSVFGQDIADCVEHKIDPLNT